MGDIYDSIDKCAGRGYIITNGVMEELTGAIKVTTKRAVKTRTRKPLGQRITQTKVTGVENSGTLTVDHYETARFNTMLDEYESSGKMPLFDLQIINEDEGSTVGRRVVRYYDCILNADVSLSELEDNSDDAVTVDIGFSFKNKKILEDYTRP